MNNKSFEETCYDFQNNILNIFNEENQLPFLLKYYLLKEVWEDVERYKIRLNQEMKMKQDNKNKQ